LTDPEKSWEAFDTMVKNSEEVMRSLGLPYQLVVIVSGTLNDVHPRKSIWKHGSHSKKNSKNLFLVPIVQTTNPVPLKSVVVIRHNLARQRNMSIV
jgi:hypothetical protein